MNDTLVVVPTCRRFEIPWQNIPVDWCIVHDQQEREITYEETPDDDIRWQWVPDQDSGLPSSLEKASATHHIIAPDQGIYGAKTSAIRQAGLDLGYSLGYKYVLTLDDDCQVPPDWAERHVKALRGLVPVAVNTVPGQPIRGLPVDANLPVGISLGLWSGVLDWPAWYQVSSSPEPVAIADRGWSKISSPFPMCGMNVGFRREVLPAVYFQHAFLRHDDIFAGWMAQQVCDLHGFGYVSGGAVVKHERLSDAAVNLEKETPGDAVNDRLLQHIRGFHTTYLDPAGTYQRLVEHVARLKFPSVQNQFDNMIRGMRRWIARRQS